MAKKGVKKKVNSKKAVSKKAISKKLSACCSDSKYGSCSGAGYCLGVIGAIIYYVSTANGFWMGVLGVLKSLVWPAFLVYEVLKFLVA